jgi:hypothetical protein
MIAYIGMGNLLKREIEILDQVGSKFSDLKAKKENKWPHKRQKSNFTI